MRILHTADWHLGDRLGRIDRTTELQETIAHIARLCLDEKVDVLLIAGDLFSDRCRSDSLRASVEHLANVFLPFLLKGGTILAVTGNHDNDTFCQTVRHVMNLAAPSAFVPGSTLPRGRFFLAAEPTLLRLHGDDGPVQFVLMPYPTPSRYLEMGSYRYQDLEEKNRALQTAFSGKLEALRRSAEFLPDAPAILVAHLHVTGAITPNLFRITEEEDIVIPSTSLASDWAYVALGHIHSPQSLTGPHVRYSGSIARLDLGERNDNKGVVLFDMGADGCTEEPRFIPLNTRPIYAVNIASPRLDIPQLRNRHPDAANALVQYHVTYEAGKDLLNEILAQIDEIFPHWYDRSWHEIGELSLNAGGTVASAPAQSLRDSVTGYLAQRLDGHADRREILALAQALLEDEE